MSNLRSWAFRLLVAASLCWSAITAGQASVTPKAYDAEDAYQIFSLLLPDEESYGFAKGTLVIQEDTLSNAVSESCLTPDAASRFREAIADYKRINSKPWLLQRKFQIEKPYEIVSSDDIGVAFGDGGWKGFHKRWPNSGGYIVMSAVGFNKEKTQAIVYTGSGCGGSCGRWRFHLLEKIDGKWNEVRGVSTKGKNKNDMARTERRVEKGQRRQSDSQIV